MNKEDRENFSQREIRRKRRRQAQIKAYIVLLVLIIIVLVGAVFGLRALGKYVEKKVEEKENASQIEAETETVTEQEISEEDNTNTSEGEADPLGELVDSMIAEMTDEEKAAAVFMISPETLTGVEVVVQAGDGTKAALEKYSIGGLIYQAQNIKSKDQFKEMITNTNSYSKFPMFYAVSEESGKGTLMGKTDLGVDGTPTAEELASGDTDAVYSAYSTIANYLSEYGFNVDLAPVSDILTNENNSNLTGRTFGSDPQTVKDMVAFATDALEQKEVSATLMKFPGEGDMTTGDDGVEVTNKSLSDLKDSEFVPYKAGIEAGADFVMMSHICAPTVNGDTMPCSMSSVMMNDVLRSELGFNGVIITDAMNQDIITSKYSSAEASVNAIKSGADMVLEPDNFEEAYQGVFEAIQSGDISEDRINDALHHIFCVKYQGVLDEETEETISAEESSEEETTAVEETTVAE